MSIKLNSSLHIGIVGCGWLGSAIAKELKQQLIQCTAFVRSIDSANQLQEERINAILYDATKPKSFPKNLSIDVLIIALPPSAAIGNKRYDEIISENVSAGKKEGIERFVFTSSTGVYSNESGFYDEDGFLNNSERANNLVNAENALANNCNKYIIVRLGGLNDQNRNPSNYGKNTKLPGNEVVNMIYKDDAVGAILHLIVEGANGIYNVVAPIHPYRSEFYNSALNQNSIQSILMCEEEFPIVRTISSDKLIKSGYAFKFPNPVNFPMKNSTIK
jgi:nucleoside-diphosphate-sugar epimerase